MRFLSYLILLFSFSANALTSSLSSQRTQVMESLAKSGTQSFILNPACVYNKANITDANNIVTRVVSGGLGDLGTDCQVDATASGQKAIWAWRAYPNRLESQNCEAIGYYKGDASKYKINIVQDSATVNSVQLTNSTAGQVVSINFPCGADNTDLVTAELEATDNAAALINFVWLHGGEATNIGSVAQPEVVVRATGTPSNTINGTNPTIWVTKSLDLYGEYNNTNGIFTAKRDGQYCWEASVEIDGTKATNNFITFAAKKNGIILPGLGLQRVANVSIGTISITSSNCVDLSKNDTLKFVVATNIGTPVFISSQVNALSITRFPTASEQVFRVGAPGLEWTAFTPTGSWTGGITYSGFYKCSGEDLEVNAVVNVTGAVTPTSTNLQLNLPSGFTIDTNKLAASTQPEQILGETTWVDAAVIDGGIGKVRYENSTSVKLTWSNASSAALASSNFQHTSPITFGSGDKIFAKFKVPVTADSPCPRTPMPLLKNAVTTESDSVVRLAFGRLAAPSACTIQNGSVGFASVSSPSTGECAVVFTKAFSQIPSCTCNMRNATVFDAVYCRITALSTTGITTRLLEGTTPRNEPVVITCMGLN